MAVDLHLRALLPGSEGCVGGYGRGEWNPLIWEDRLEIKATDLEVGRKASTCLEEARKDIHIPNVCYCQGWGDRHWGWWWWNPLIWKASVEVLGEAASSLLSYGKSTPSQSPAGKKGGIPLPIFYHGPSLHRVYDSWKGWVGMMWSPS